MDQLIFASLSHTHYWYEVGMLKVPFNILIECRTCIAIRTKTFGVNRRDVMLNHVGCAKVSHNRTIRRCRANQSANKLLVSPPPNGASMCRCIAKLYFMFLPPNSLTLSTYYIDINSLSIIRRRGLARNSPFPPHLSTLDIPRSSPTLPTPGI